MAKHTPQPALLSPVLVCHPMNPLRLTALLRVCFARIIYVLYTCLKATSSAYVLHILHAGLFRLNAPQSHFFRRLQYKKTIVRHATCQRYFLARVGWAQIQGDGHASMRAQRPTAPDHRQLLVIKITAAILSPGSLLRGFHITERAVVHAHARAHRGAHGDGLPVDALGA